MFVELDLPRAHQRREELMREVRSERLERELRAGRGHRRERRWSFRIFGIPASDGRA
jgi:hypothetical protein